jgi:phosphatidylglycerophosphatase GEP4
VRMFSGLATGKISGPNTRKAGAGCGGPEFGSAETVPVAEVVDREGGVRDAARNSTGIEAGLVPTSASGGGGGPETGDTVEPPQYAPGPTPPVRLLVIGDRLFTDTLLANRLRKALGPDNVVSIQTTSLPLPSDVRFLRWIEARLSRNRLRTGKEDWGRFVIRDDAEEAASRAETGLGWRRYMPFRRQWVDAPELGWRVGTWTPWGVIRGLWSGLSRIGRGVKKGSRWTWTRGSLWVRAKREARRVEEAAAAARLVELPEAASSVAIAGGAASKVANVAASIK